MTGAATKEIMQLAYERTKATELAAALGKFIVGEPEPPRVCERHWGKLKSSAQQTLDEAFALIEHHTERIKQLKEMT